ncbi:hypothetical protein V6N11_002495 [Hibiscus sabdariffa]|uniref:Mitochondrial import inner membrane translocase subunit n=1 Tax=Hibiscus sabdariffa TaxID=183260 RepID=A0ABR2SAJ2_9ROSI
MFKTDPPDSVSRFLLPFILPFLLVLAESLNPNRGKSCKVPMAAPNIPAGINKEQAFGMAETEMEYRVELFNRLGQTCFNKCVDKRYKEAELNMGENSCIDRCVSKYWQVNSMIGQMLSAGGQPPV